MSKFPTTEVGGLTLSRMIIGTNWFVGYSHTSPAKDSYIKNKIYDREKLADIIEVFLNSGVNSIMGILQEDETLLQGIEEAEQRTGEKVIKITTPIINVANNEQAKGETKACFDKCAEINADLCMPHHTSVEELIDKKAEKIRRIDEYTKMIRDRDMIPGLSAHMPEVIKYADKNDNDVETYIQIYNAAGFLMQVEIEYINKVINNAKKPVMTIKPMAAGRLSPFVGFNFVWNTIREQDMVTVGTMTPREAAEDIEISLAALERRQANIGGRESPNKTSIMEEE